MKKIIFLISLAFLLMCSQPIFAKDIQSLESASYILMDGMSGKVLHEKNSELKLPPASITKIMTMLLTLESVERGEISLDDIVTVSETAAKHEGSHVFLDVGEQISVDDLLKAVAVASGNDAACALAEHVSGTQESFVQKMNTRAKEIGMHNTFFENCNGLDSENHLTTAKDIALMTFEISKHKDIFRYTGIWMDTLRNGTFDLANTNKLIRFYDGATGMKTGFTSKAGYCLSATAERDGVALIAVVMQAPTSTGRFGDASALLNYGFEHYTQFKACEKGQIMSEISVKNGEKHVIETVCCEDVCVLVPSDRTKDIETKIICKNAIDAPVDTGQSIGKVEFLLDERVVGETELIPLHAVEKKDILFYSVLFVNSLLSAL